MSAADLSPLAQETWKPPTEEAEFRALLAVPKTCVVVHVMCLRTQIESLQPLYNHESKSRQTGGAAGGPLRFAPRDCEPCAGQAV